ncbi:nitric oxide dioxygenase [Halobacillus karajensis]|uniref:Flavohemoprotein n=1 Tax=Halobacillus karajensis TaxID=195088 RepID=A0A059NYZ5_9BACI|nr:NO-inducible flavohemoprotein [Halobacillus karajensis]CDQ18422.1 Nitric oxide dioxygenase [Halobacillus karajensis]CDQ23506.1 Nitric oxide dioxygenase [Halobacillus karajensis]CDQ26988.1 Nitric oxide dioxygenase [Halobacillus karajensis]SEH51591.1 nitric oxide dioxygenase [Halobacillus karajensis]
MSAKTTETLNKQTIETVKATVPVLEEYGEAITTHFYQRLFEDHPELKNIFNQTHQHVGDQPKALANTVYAAAQYIDQLEVILPRVKQIAEKHRSLNVQPEHYPIVGEYLLKAIKEVLGEAATDDIINAWGNAYGVIADAFIGVEKEMYQEAEQQKGGWTGYRLFKVAGKVQESDEITSFYLEPEDGGELPVYKPGQYLTIKAEIPGESYDHLRQYSLSEAPGKPYYRISVKKELGTAGQPDGIVSSWLHDKVKTGDSIPVSAPAGDFYLNAHTDRPVVLISGGVGLTPMMSMWRYAREKQPEREVRFIHAARNGSVHAFKEEIKGAKPGTAHLIYEKPSEEDMKQGLYVREGYISLEWLKTVAPEHAEFYFCGPEGFMRAVNHMLQEWRIPEERIHYEFFGPQGVL